MYADCEILGIIGIRSGSTAVPDKNIRPLAGKPLVGWVIESARKSRSLTRLIVSTDSARYAEIAKTLGAEVPCLRPDYLAADDSPEFDYVKHMLDWLKEKEGYVPDVVVRLMATVPLQRPEDIDAVVDVLLRDNSADSAVIIAEARQHPMKALKIIDDQSPTGRLVTYFGESGRDVTPIPRQNYPKAYFRANTIVVRNKVIEQTKTLTGDIVRYHIIPQIRAIDIDSFSDFYHAETILEKVLSNNHRVD